MSATFPLNAAVSVLSDATSVLIPVVSLLILKNNKPNPATSRTTSKMCHTSDGTDSFIGARDGVGVGVGAGGVEGVGIRSGIMILVALRQAQGLFIS